MSVDQRVVNVAGVGKRYRSRWVLQDVDLHVDRGEVVGFIGPNGAGKSTLLRLVCGLAAPTTGTVTVDGHQLTGRASPSGVAMVLEEQGLLPQLSARRNLRLLQALTTGRDDQRITEVLTTVGLDLGDTRAVRTWSLGMRQRLVLAQALLDRPRLLLLDEPTNGLDPAGVADLRDLLFDLAAHHGVGVLLASHALTEVERLADRTYLVAGGRVLEEITAGAPASTTLRVSTAAHATAAGEVLRARRLPHTTHGTTLEVPAPVTVPDLVRDLVAADVAVEEIGTRRASLEDRFLALVRGGDHP